jgi:hypothetical protein
LRNNKRGGFKRMNAYALESLDKFVVIPEKELFTVEGGLSAWDAAFAVIGAVGLGATVVAAVAAAPVAVGVALICTAAGGGYAIGSLIGSAIR